MGASEDFAGARAVVLGLGRFGGGLGAVRWLRRRGADVVVTDLADAATLGDAAVEAGRLGAQLVLGGHEGVDVAGADLLVVNPAVPLGAPLVAAARDAGVRVSTEIALLLERWRGPVIGVTGSNGKSTTTTLVHALLRASGVDAVRGGNLGGSLLDRLDEGPTDSCVAALELSSFMLEALDVLTDRVGEVSLGPDVGVLLNITPNHLDRHGDMQSYTNAKAAVFRRSSIAILNGDDARVRAVGAGLDCERRWFGTLGIAEDAALALDARGDLVDADGRRVVATEDVPLAGRMNRIDLAAAVLAVEACLEGRAELAVRDGHVRDDLPRALAGFEAPPHRLTIVADHLGVRWIDDSVSTTPESTAASLQALAEPCVLVAGGHDKGLDPTPLVDAAAAHAALVLTVGEEGPGLARRLADRGVPVEEVGTVAEAVARAADRAARGEAGRAVLLSPGYSSHDQYRDFTARGHDFARCVHDLASRAPGSAGPAGPVG